MSVQYVYYEMKKCGDDLVFKTTVDLVNKCFKKNREEILASLVDKKMAHQFSQERVKEDEEHEERQERQEPLLRSKIDI